MAIKYAFTTESGFHTVYIRTYFDHFLGVQQHRSCNDNFNVPLHNLLSVPYLYTADKIKVLQQWRNIKLNRKFTILYAFIKTFCVAVREIILYHLLMI